MRTQVPKPLERVTHPLERGSRPAAAADAAETLLCATLAATTLLGLVLFAAFGWWWADPIAALAVAWLAIREGREAWHGELVCDD